MKKWKNMTKQELKTEKQRSGVTAILVMLISALHLISFLIIPIVETIVIGVLLGFLAITLLIFMTCTGQELRLREYMEENKK